MKAISRIFAATYTHRLSVKTCRKAAFLESNSSQKPNKDYKIKEACYHLLLLVYCNIRIDPAECNKLYATADATGAIETGITQKLQNVHGQKT